VVLNIDLLSFIMLIVVMLNVHMLNVVTPMKYYFIIIIKLKLRSSEKLMVNDLKAVEIWNHEDLRSFRWSTLG